MGISSFEGKNREESCDYIEPGMITLVIIKNQREKCQIAHTSACRKTSFIYYRAHISILGLVALTKRGCRFFKVLV